ncbi:MAG: sulfatase, partial [Opitutae bacterium]|nr:sulfatase [Opitutae bacterium]
MKYPLSTRRNFLQKASLGFGSLALAGLYGAPMTPHHPPPAKNVIFLFMEGGVSQVDSFDYKPMLSKYHGEDPRQAIGKIEATQFEKVGRVMKSPWAFKQRGKCGAWISELFPHIAELADELAIIRSMTANFPEHTSACYYM